MSLDEVITPALFEDKDMLITKWVVVAEYVRPDGTRGLVRQWSESCAPWDVDALLAWTWPDQDDDDA